MTDAGPQTRTANGSAPEWPSIYIAIVGLIALAFLFSVKSILSPVIAFLILMLLISPWVGTRMHLLIVVAATALLAVWILDTLGTLLAPFVLAFVLAYILDPIVDRLERRGIKRVLAVGMVFVPFILLVALALVFGVPALIEQISILVERIPVALQRAVDWIQNARIRLMNSNLPLIKGEAFARMLDNFSPERVAAYINTREAEIAQRLWSGVMGVGKGVSIALSILGYAVLTPVLTIYLLKDFDRLTSKAGSLIPRDKRGGWIPFIKEYNRLLASYLRGQVIAASLVGILTFLGLWIAGFPYPGLVAVVAGVFNMVPYLGLIVSLIPGIIIALLSGDIASSLIKLGVVFAVVQAIDGNITGPRIVGESTGLHPVWVILALAIGASFFGLVGLLIAMPAAVFIKLVVNNAVMRYRASRVFEGEPLPVE